MTSTASVSLPGARLTDHRIRVPLDHADPHGESIEVFAREVAAPDGLDRPYLLFLQGGPGQESPRPTSPLGPSWLGRALQDFRVVLLDQRGTGLSTPYDRPGADPVADAERLRHFRADAIVRDAELLREHLGARRWSLLGQSFGGFTSLNYLSVAPDSLREVFFTGGLPPVGRPVDEVYSATYRATRALNRRFHARFPGDRERLARLLAACDADEVRAPDGSPVSARLARTIGLHLGMDGGAESIHFLLERDPRSAAFAYDLQALLPFSGRNPLYAVLHESSYADGGVTGWAAERVAPDDFRGYSDLLTGEHLFPWHFDDTPSLRPFKPVAEVIAETRWPRLYDPAVLAAVDVPAAAAVYADDPFVDRAFSLETAELLPGLRPWLTNEHLHNGLRSNGAEILDRLIGLARGLR